MFDYVTTRERERKNACVTMFDKGLFLNLVKALVLQQNFYFSYHFISVIYMWLKSSKSKECKINQKKGIKV